MLIGVVKEVHPGENRCALIPSSVDRLVKKGAQVAVETGLGSTIGVPDSDYQKAGATMDSRSNILKNSDILLRLRKPPLEEVAQLKKGSLHISFLDPFNEKALVEALASNNINAISMEMIPRSTRAQKMDALSSQANLAGYVMVLMAAERLPKIFPMLMTPAGTIQPARVFIIGAGVAGLQAIATAKRLGARVEAFDTRPVVKEQVQSLGAKFVEIDLGETGQTAQGYAKALTPEQIEKQRQGMTKVCAQSDVIITTAQLFGRKAPVLLTKDMIAQMKPGTIIVDMAVESGGNVEGSKVNEEVTTSNGVRIIGLANLPGKVAVHASQMYSANLHNLLEEYWKTETKSFNLDIYDEIIKGALVTYGGAVINEMVKNAK
jgi:H+-translocating NAD(P) transhydrogenase subunit alpha